MFPSEFVSSFLTITHFSTNSSNGLCPAFTYFASNANAMMPAANGADAEVPLNSSVH